VATQLELPETLPEESSTTDVVRAILDYIKSQRLAVGERLPTIRILAASLGVRATVVRDALLRAETMGLVRVVPRSGAFIQSLNYGTLVDALASTLPSALVQRDHNLFYLLDARRLVEIELAARAATDRRLEELLPVRQALEGMHRAKDDRVEYVEYDIRFHLEIARLGRNTVLLTIEQALLEMLRPHLVQLPWSAERRDRANRSHAAIYEALAAGDAEKARAEMRTHLGMAYDSLLKDMTAPPSGEPRS
jgi:GntR family transcriptional repressor for pyruvate dehydrogenase complex